MKPSINRCLGSCLGRDRVGVWVRVWFVSRFVFGFVAGSCRVSVWVRVWGSVRVRIWFVFGHVVFDLYCLYLGS